VQLVCYETYFSLGEASDRWRALLASEQRMKPALARGSCVSRVRVAGYYRQREKQPAPLSLPDQAWENTQAAPLLLPESHPEADPVRWTEAREDWQAVVGAINRLTEEQRQVLVGRLILGYDVATVAHMLGKKASAVKAPQFRALQNLQRLLGKPRRPIPALQKQRKKEEGE
jgi:RNA polymerase sigma-70 factor, ECF subfamily